MYFFSLQSTLIHQDQAHHKFQRTQVQDSAALLITLNHLILDWIKQIK